MPFKDKRRGLDTSSKTNLIRGIVKAAEIENDAALPDAMRLKAREKREAYNRILNKFRQNAQSTDSNN